MFFLMPELPTIYRNIQRVVSSFGPRSNLRLVGNDAAAVEYGDKGITLHIFEPEAWFESAKKILPIRRDDDTDGITRLKGDLKFLHLTLQRTILKLNTH